MNKVLIWSLTCSISLLMPLATLGSPCSDAAKDIISNSSLDSDNPATLQDLASLSHKIGPGEKQQITEQTYTWKSSKGSYSLVVRDGITIDVDDQGMHPDFGKRKYPSLAIATKQLGKPEIGPAEQMTKTVWNCQDTRSFIAIFTDKSGKIIDYSGKYCPSMIFNDDCAAFED